MILLTWIGILVVSMTVLVKASDYFTISAEKIGIFLGVPNFVIGITIVSIGTSLPEFLTSMAAAIVGSPEIVVGNVVGSNITNIFLGLGLLPIIIGFFKIGKKLISTDLPILIGSSFLLAVTCWDGKFTLLEALFCLAGFLVYMIYALEEHREYNRNNSEHKEDREKLAPKTIIILVLSCLFLYLGAKYTVDAIIKISAIINIGTEIISASAIALGTSLPEIITSIVVIRKGKIDIAVGTLLGSNIFNAFAIMGFSGLVGTIAVPAGMLSFGIPMLILATLLYFFITLDQEITVWEGWLLIIFYGVYIAKLLKLM
jgi:cation:H+ antiporter